MGHAVGKHARLLPSSRGSNLESSPEASDVIGIVRLHCYHAGVFWLVDVEQKEAKKRRLELAQEGWIITHTEVV